MPRRSFRIVKKNGSFKKRRGVIGKKSKAQRKRGSRRRIKMIRGGASWLNEQTDLSVVWNSLFYERVQTQFKKFLPRINPKSLEKPASGSDIKKVLFVIDMQKDFVDRPYVRTGGDKHPVFQSDNVGGNFAVTDAIKMLGGLKTDTEAMKIVGDKGSSEVVGDKGSSEVVGDEGSSEDNPEYIIKKSDFLMHIKAALEEGSDYTHVIFSRDYHPVGHCSFNNRWFNEQTLCNGCDNGGNFPAHCVQGFEGSKFVPEIEYLIKTHGGTKAKVVFKGVDKDCDSFTAVPKISIDHNASNVNPDIERKKCSSVTGAYLLKDTTHNLTNEPFQMATADKVTYDEGGNLDLSTATHIEVCGLAGDYCVRDTVVALADKFKNTKIVLLNDFARYPTLPFVTIGLLPQHNYKGNQKSILPVLSDYDKQIDPTNIGPSPIISYDEIKSYFEDNFNPTSVFTFRKERALEFLKYALSATKTTEQYKDIIYYLLRKSEEGVLKLLPANSIELQSFTDSVTTDILGDPTNLTNFVFTTYEHFITPLEAIIFDYTTRPNIYIQMNNLLRKP